MTSPATQPQLTEEALEKELTEVLAKLADQQNLPSDPLLLTARVQAINTQLIALKTTSLQQGQLGSSSTSPPQTVPPMIASPFESSTKRAPEDRLKEKAIYKRKDRPSLQGKTLKYFMDGLKEGPPKGSGYRDVKIEDILQSNEEECCMYAHDILKINDRLYKQLTRFDVTEIFDIYQFGPGGIAAGPIGKVNLFVDWNSITAEDVVASCNAWTTNHSDKSYGEDLMWTPSTSGLKTRRLPKRYLRNNAPFRNTTERDL